MRAQPEVEHLIPPARAGDRRALARLITHVENGTAGGDAALAALYRDTGSSWTTGLTGAPGAGKSTLSDRLIAIIRSLPRDVAVLAVDPSSPFTGGAILGDRVRMQGHIDDIGVYIRSMASRGHLGGISAATPKVLTVLDAAGFDEIIVETVGVGQAEVDVAANADTTIVVLNPGWGDSVQAAKAGLLEVGDVFVVNKADRPGVEDTIRDLKQMLELGQHGDWWPPIVATIATDGTGLDGLWEAVENHRAHLNEGSRLQDLRRRRLVDAMDAAVMDALASRLDSIRDQSSWADAVAQVEQRMLDPWSAARRLVDAAG